MAEESETPFHQTAIVVAIWFILNIAMSNILKWTYVYGALTMADGTVLHYKFPLFISVLHMLASFIMCGVYLRYIKGWPEKTLTLDQQIRNVWPLGVCFALSIAANNMSLMYIYPSLNQMLASLGPVITVGLAVMVSGTRYNVYTWTSMLGISGGLVVCAKFDADFNLFGVVFAISATALRGMKSIIQQRILTEKVDSMLLLFYMAPCAGLSMLVGSVLQEGHRPITIFFDSDAVGARTCMLLLAMGSCNACFLNLANFLVTKYTSAVTLQVMGNIKSCLSIFVSVLVFGNELRAEQGIGVAICIFGTWVYNKKGGKLQGGEACMPMFAIDTAADVGADTKVAPAKEEELEESASLIGAPTNGDDVEEEPDDKAAGAAAGTPGAPRRKDDDL